MKKLIALVLCLCCMLMNLSALAEVSYPIENGPTLTVWIAMDAGNSQAYTNYADSPVWQKFMEVTGVKLEFMHPTYGAAGEGFSTMIANVDDWPDLIIDFDAYYNGGANAAYEDDVIYDLTPYLEEYAPDYYALINRDEKTRIQFYNENDQCLAFYNFAYEDDPQAYCLVVRPDWCEEWGIDVASMTTYDAIEEYFAKVLAEKPGVIPFQPDLANKKSLLPIMLWGYDLLPGFMAVDGEIKYYANQENYKAWLERMHSWYKKGYIGQDYASLKNATIRKMYAAGEVACLIVGIGNAYSDSQASGIPIDKTPFLRETEDTIIHVYSYGVNTNIGIASVVTKHCDESLLPVVCQFMNYCYSEEGLVFSNWGPEGMTWEYNSEGKRQHTDWVLNNPTHPTSIMHNVCRLHYWPHAQLSDLTCSANIIKDPVITEMRGRYAQAEYFQTDYYIPSAVTLTAEEAEERDSILVDIEAYVSEMMYKFIQGDADIEAEWENYCKTLEHYRLNDAIQLEQDAYDRYVARLANVN
ncbi:MAG: extracellular solute-binding protein [Clostridia bacterium]|nr:extracellular solute-binding protein [Clostridia bacterium]